MLDGIETGSVIADKGYESNRILAHMRSRGATAVIPPKANRRNPWEYDRELYRRRNLIERAFNKLKYWRRIATLTDLLPSVIRPEVHGSPPQRPNFSALLTITVQELC